jgi:hypothetical protein
VLRYSVADPPAAARVVAALTCSRVFNTSSGHTTVAATVPAIAPENPFAKALSSSSVSVDRGIVAARWAYTFDVVGSFTAHAMNIRVAILLAFASSSSSSRCIGDGDGTTVAIGSFVVVDGREDIPTHATRARRGMK